MISLSTVSEMEGKKALCVATNHEFTFFDFQSFDVVVLFWGFHSDSFFFFNVFSDYCMHTLKKKAMSMTVNSVYSFCLCLYVS